MRSMGDRKGAIAAQRRAPAPGSTCRPRDHSRSEAVQTGPNWTRTATSLRVLSRVQRPTHLCLPPAPSSGLHGLI